MPTGKNWLIFGYIHLAFLMYAFVIFYYGQMAAIKEDWAVNRCNPAYMPLADDVEANFVYCVQNMQSSFMGTLLEPLTYLSSIMGTTLGGFAEDIQNIRAMFDKIRTLFTSVIQSVFGVFLNLVIEFERITIGIKDLIGKTIGVMVTMMYVMDGSLKTMNSTWNGPPGQMVRSLGKCFHPDTKVTTQDGRRVAMSELSLGEILEDGLTRVEAVMRIDNRTSNIPFYCIEGREGEPPIYVTGSHYVFDKGGIQRYIRVDTYAKAKPTQIVVPEFACLLTSTHRIPVSGETFWDWDDQRFVIYF
jgi:hypothetical protein